MKLTPKDGEWPSPVAPLGATVLRASIDGANGELHLSLTHPSTQRSSEVAIPPPWVFTSCLLSLSSDQFAKGEPGLISAYGLIGLEGATLSAIERDEKRIDLVFDSIRIQVSGE